MVEIKAERLYVVVVVTQSCLTLCDPMDWSLLGSSVHGILQARILEWVAIPFSRGSSPPRDWTQVFCVAGRFFNCIRHQGSPGIRLKFTLHIQVGWFAFLKQLLGWQGSGSLGLSWFVSVAPHLEAICLKHVNILFAFCFLHELKSWTDLKLPINNNPCIIFETLSVQWISYTAIVQAQSLHQVAFLSHLPFKGSLNNTNIVCHLTE